MSVPAARSVTTESLGAPYEKGDFVRVCDADRTTYRGRVENIAPHPGGYDLVASIVAPRRFRNMVVVAHVDATGSGPHISPWDADES